MKNLKHITSLLILILTLVSATASNGLQTQSNANAPTFIENKGQWPEEVLYLANLSGMNAWITTTGVTYDHFTVTRQNNPQEFRFLPPHERREKEGDGISIQGHVVRMTMLNVNCKAQASNQDHQSCYHNYFISNDPSKWASNVQLFGQVGLAEIYEGIAVKYYFDQGQLRYDYLLAPGADIGQLRFQLEGADGWQIAQSGELLIETSLGKVSHGKLYAYQLIDCVKIEIDCSFAQYTDGSLGLLTGDYDRSKPLVVDPLVFSTYLGGSGFESHSSLVLAPDGSPVVAGQSLSNNFPVTVGAYQTVKNADFDITISKLNPTASSLVFSTYLGGNSKDEYPDVNLGSDGSIYITGTTESTDFPVTFGVFQTANLGGKSAFIARLNSNSTSLIYSSYLGGAGEDRSQAIVVDATGSAYLTGYSYSDSFPTTPGTINYEGGSLFVVKVNPTATSLTYSAVFAMGQGYGIDIDEVGRVFITGYVYWDTYFPVTPDAFQTQPTGYFCAFATVIDSTATEVLYSTYLTGDYQDFGETICVAPNGDVIVGGNTDSDDFPSTPESFQPINAGNTDAFVVRLNPTCTEMIWGTLLGENDLDELYGMSLDASENVAITGNTWSPEFPVTTNLSGIEDMFSPAFVSLISYDGSELLYSVLLDNESFIETNGDDVSVNDDGHIILSGSTGNFFLITPDAYQPIFGGGYVDMFITSILPVNCQTECSTTVLNHVSCRDGADGQAQVNPSGGVEPYSFLWSNGQTTAIASGLASGSYTVVITDTIGCTAEASVYISQPTQLALASLQSWPASCANSADGGAIAQASGGTPPYSYEWGNGETGNQAIALMPGENTLTIIDNNDCEKEVVFEIGYIPPFEEEEICAVTLNQETSYNMVVWEKTEGVRTIAYNIYRESSASGIYELIGSTNFDEPPLFDDETAIPSQQSYRYKLSVVDSCQEESGLSDFHKTIHLSMNMGINGEVNLLWSPYEGFSYPTHFILRSVNAGPYQLIGQMPASNFSFTDLTPPTGLKKYKIEIDAPGGCGLRDFFRVSSNAVIVLEIGVDESVSSAQFRIVPNPGDGHFRMEIPTAFLYQKHVVQVYNSLGLLVFSKESQATETGIAVDIKDQPTGIYLLQVSGKWGVTYRKIVKE